ncbi:FbpB family small basic protein [Microaerobacter geothermalis]|uniref:FbpB family small basic protein n=1 Tax=Microaerobacter geothermalis TaxID=674972 RepID=UPI001F412295|nr:FbpB family small basic protein [Microaerobacter geothermalis]MCF6092491.1 FbpB family small basic protein [Microaerobacter geothermalis]
MRTLPISVKNELVEKNKEEILQNKDILKEIEEKVENNIMKKSFAPHPRNTNNHA